LFKTHGSSPLAQTPQAGLAVSTTTTGQCGSALGSALEARKNGLVASFIDGRRWIGLDRGMPIQDAATILQEILGEADTLIASG
jgi:hypothetical protein